MVRYIEMSVLFLIFIMVGFAGFDFFLSHTQYRTIEEQVYGSITIPLAAVDENEHGLILPMAVEVRQGTGKVLINIDNPSFIVDTQNSMRVAVHEAARIARADISKVDVLFSINGNVAQIVGGPSAGSAMAVATAAALMNKKLRSDVVISGTIEQGGDIGPVGGLVEKAKTAKSAGASLFLVPRGQAYQNEPIENCDTDVGTGYSYRRCSVSYKTTAIADLSGIEVREVSTLADALQLMIEE